MAKKNNENQDYIGMEIKKNSNGQIHCENGPAMIDQGVCEWWYKEGILHRTDGPAIHFYDSPEDDVFLIDGIPLCDAGFDLGKKIVMNPSELTIKEIEGIENQEIKRIAIERLGVDNFLKMAKAKVVDIETNDIEGTKEVLFKTKDITYFCGICKSTGRMYYIPVDPKINTCVEAREFMCSGFIKPLDMVGGS